MPPARESPLQVVPTDDGEGFALLGELDMEAADTLIQSIEPRVEPGATLVLDLEALTFIDSSGVRALWEVAQRLRSGKLVLRHPHNTVRRVIEIVRLPDVEPGIVVED